MKKAKNVNVGDIWQTRFGPATVISVTQDHDEDGQYVAILGRLGSKSEVVHTPNLDEDVTILAFEAS